MHERFRTIALSAWGRLVTTRAGLTLVTCLLLAAAAAAVAVARLEFRPDRSDLINPAISWNKRYHDYKENFPRWNDVIVVLDAVSVAEDGTTEGLLRAQNLADELARKIAAELRKDPLVHVAESGFDSSEGGPKLFMLAPREKEDEDQPGTFEHALREMAHGRSLARAENANAALGVLLGRLNAAEDTPPAGDAQDGNRRLDELERFLRPYLDGLRGEAADFSFLSPRPSRWVPFASRNGSGPLRYVRVSFARDPNATSGGIDNLSEKLLWLRSTIRSVVDSSDSPALAWGVTGVPVVESDETTQSMHDGTKSSVLAFMAITALMVVAFRGWIVPLLAAGSLLVGLAWSFGWLVISVGHLQVLSVMFCSILMGLGIDYALLFISRLELVVSEHAEEDLPHATSRVMRGAGPGMITGALTAAAAFASTALTDFAGMSEMGIIAGGGILLCLIAILCCLPASLALTGAWKRIIRHRPGGESAHFGRGWLDVFDSRPVATLIGTALVVAALLFMAQRVRYDPNVLNLQSPSVESVHWQQRIARDDAQSIWGAIVLTTPNEAADLTMRLRALPEVSDVGGMGILYPADLDERVQLVAATREAPVAAPQADRGIDPLLAQLALVQAGVRANARRAEGDIRQRLERIAESISSALTTAQALPDSVRIERWDALNSAFTAARDGLGDWIERALAPGGPTADDLPPAVRNPSIGLDGTWSLVANPATDPLGRAVLDPELLGSFVTAVSDVAPTALGPPVQIYESSRIIVRSYILAACYALATILVVLMLDFRSLADTLCAMLPAVLGFIGAFGIMGATGMTLNFANLIILPLVFGIAMDVSVNCVHRWRADPRGKPAGLSGGTGRGITLAMLTTMIGFAALLVADHRGIRSLGTVMLLGLGTALIACYTALPAVLRLRTRPGHDQPTETDDLLEAPVV
jgi:predicted RND superfamily exporter protein